MILLAATAAGALVLWMRERGEVRGAVPPAVAALAAVLLLLATGPTAAWRHSPIGAGRMRRYLDRPNRLEGWLRSARRNIAWEREGVESSVAVDARGGISLLINGKSDGNAKSDAPTMVMGGLVGAILHPQPARALVIGLGTGCTAGWLAAIESMERVDVVELEPAVLDVAALCAPVNAGVMKNTKVRITIGDAREFLQTAREPYDLIFSQPSNPYRAGVASLFTVECYEAAAGLLRPQGIYMQWLQGYEIDGGTVQVVVATLSRVFPEVEIWQTHTNDLLLLASKKPLTYDTARLRRRIQKAPFREALSNAWRATSLEGFLARYVASAAFARTLAAASAGRLQTDDRPLIEFTLPRMLNRRQAFNIYQLRDKARKQGQGRPALKEDPKAPVDWELVEDERLAISVTQGVRPWLTEELGPEQQQRLRAMASYFRGDLGTALLEWGRQPKLVPRGLTELVIIADAIAEVGQAEGAAVMREHLKIPQPTEALVVEARMHWRQKRQEEAARTLARAFVRLRTDPWPWEILLSRGLDMAEKIAGESKKAAAELYAALEKPFAINILDDKRLLIRFRIARTLSAAKAVEALAPIEPHVFWDATFLRERFEAYRDSKHPWARKARRDFNAYMDIAPPSFYTDPAR